MTVKRTERGWAGHFICAYDCLFRRNTLLEYKDTKIVVSTVGLMRNVLKGKGLGIEEEFTELGYNRYYETIAFHSDPKDTRYHDIDVTRQVSFDSPWSIPEPDADDKANDMHEAAVEELTKKLESRKLTNN